MPTQIAPIKYHVIERQGITWQKYAESRTKLAMQLELERGTHSLTPRRSEEKEAAAGQRQENSQKCRSLRSPPFNPGLASLA
jgi:hypothetical protein